MKIYFAHPVSDYNTNREKECLTQIKAYFPEAEILNPNEEVHCKAYQLQGMVYFENLVRTCDVVVAVPFEDGEYGMGVWREMEALAQKGGKTFQLFNTISEIDYKDIRPLSINETRKRVKEALASKK